MSEATDLQLGQGAVAAGLIGGEQLAACQREQAADAAAGRPPRPLAGLLVERGLLTQEQVARLFEATLHARLSSAGAAAGAPAGETVASGGAAAAPVAPPSLPLRDPADTAAATHGTTRTHATAVPPPGLASPAVAAGGTILARPDEGAARPAAGPSSAGTSFARYIVQGEIARGGMGVVYRALDPQLQRRVALKVMLGGEATSDTERHRFQREALMAARLNHPNIVPVYDVGEFDGKLYYTMELIEGESVSGILARMKVIPPRAALKIARDAARALHYAHEQSLVHRDIKPANLLITTGGPPEVDLKAGRETTISIGGRAAASFRVLLTDFGVARDVASTSRLTRTGDILGTPLYMSPEQAEGNPLLVGPVSDVYSLGAVLYETLCGRPPFTETTAVQLLAAVVLKDPPPLRSLAPGLSPDIETLVAKAMEKDPRRRYASAREFADDIDRYLAGEVIRARPATWAYRSWRGLVRHRELVGSLAGAAVLLLAVVSYFTLWPRYQAYREERRAAAARQARVADARARVAAAEAAFAGGRLDEAAATAEKLIGEYDAYGLHGEDVAMPEAHDLLARVRAGKGDARRALLERFRAYRAAVGARGSDAYLLKTARELIHQLQFDEAVPLLARVARETAAAATRAEAAYWLGRAAEGTLDFGGALRHFDRAAAPGAGLPPDLRAECAAHRDFCARFARRVPLPIPGTCHVSADADGDGRRDLVGISSDRIFVGHLDGGRWVEQGSVELRAGPNSSLVTIAVADLVPGRPPMFVVTTAGAASSEGRLWLVRWEQKGLAVLASDTLESGTQAVACGDIDGDGRRELVVGTLAYERSVRVYDWDEGARKLVQRTRVAAGGDVQAIDVCDLDGDGAAEILVFPGAWQGYGAAVWQWDAARKELVRRTSVTLGIPRSVCRIDRPGRLPLYAIGTGWDLMMVHPLRQILGRERFEASYRPPGVCLVEPQPDLSLKVTPLVAGAWERAEEGTSSVARVAGAGGDFLWCTVAPPEGRREGGSARVRSFIHLFRTGAYDAPFATFVRPSEWSKSPLAQGVQALDVDGDGAPELVAGSGPLVLLAPQAAGAAETESAGGPAGGPDAGAAAVARDPLFESASVAERVGLAEEALAAYTEAERRAGGILEVEQAALGRMRCLLSLGRAGDLVAEAEAVAARCPALEASLLREGVRLLDAGRHWAEAARLVARLLQALDLDTDAREALGKEAGRFQALAEFRYRLRLVGRDATPLDWLVTSPFIVAARPDGGWKVRAAPLSEESVLAPVTNTAGAWRLSGTLSGIKLDWGGNLGLGAGNGGPSRSLDLGSGGDTNWPLYTLGVSSPLPGNALSWLLSRRGEAWDAPLSFDLVLVAHQHKLVCRVRGGLREAEERACELEAIAAEGNTILAGLRMNGSARPEYWSAAEIDELEFAAAASVVEPVIYRAVTAAQHLLLANGRWVSGRAAEALRHYDQAVALADLERTKEEAARGKGWSSIWDEPGVSDAVRWAHVDARLYRGLLRGAGGDAAGSLADLRAAWGLSAERFRLLLQRHAAPLAQRPAEVAALRAFWRDLAGNPAADKRLAWVKETLAAMGPAATEALIEGCKIAAVTQVRVKAVTAGGPADRVGLRAGDVILRVDEAAIATVDELKATLEAAAKSGRKEVKIEIRRGDKSGGGSLPATLGLGIEVEAETGTEIRLEKR